MDARELTADELAGLLRAASQAHHDYVTELGRPDEDWPAWYAEWVVARLRERGGEADP